MVDRIADRAVKKRKPEIWIGQRERLLAIRQGTVRRGVGIPKIVNLQRMNEVVTGGNLYILADAPFNLQAAVLRIGIWKILCRKTVGETLCRRNPRSGWERNSHRPEFRQADQRLRRICERRHVRIMHVAIDRSERGGGADQFAPVERAEKDAKSSAHHCLWS